MEFGEVEGEMKDSKEWQNSIFEEKRENFSLYIFEESV